MIFKVLSSKKKRVACFIDGFNLYHAIDDLGKDHLKWINLRALMEHFHSPQVHELGEIYYFTAIAEWLKDQAARHKAYIEALRTVGVTPILGRFKEKPAGCHRCGASWTAHEEKQTDVNIATWMIQEAFNNRYEEAFLVSKDSDLVPPLKLIKTFPKTRDLKIICPPGRRHAKELIQVANKKASILEFHLEKCLFPKEVKNAAGVVVASRPPKYDPPPKVK